MLDLQRVKHRIGGPSSIGSLRSVSLGRFDDALGSVGATLAPTDVWGDDGPETEDAGNDRREAVRPDEADPDDSDASPCGVSARSILSILSRLDEQVISDVEEAMSARGEA